MARRVRCVLCCAGLVLAAVQLPALLPAVHHRPVPRLDGQQRSQQRRARAGHLQNDGPRAQGPRADCAECLGFLLNLKAQGVHLRDARPQPQHQSALVAALCRPPRQSQQRRHSPAGQPPPSPTLMAGDSRASNLIFM